MKTSIYKQGRINKEFNAYSTDKLVRKSCSNCEFYNGLCMVTGEDIEDFKQAKTCGEFGISLPAFIRQEQKNGR